MNTDEHVEMAAMMDALDNRAAASSPVNFWLRDDDAALPSASLERLLELTEAFSIPLTLAVIPAMTGNALAQRLADAEHVSVAVHGWSHTNHANDKEKKQELGSHRPASVVLAELQRGFATLQQLHPERFIPLLVPPWNRISGELVEQLGTLGFKGLSTYGNNTANMSVADIVQVNTQVDIIDWKGHRGGRSAIELTSEIVDQLQQVRSSVGVLTHHLDHDEAAWQFLEQLFRVTSAHSGARWLPVADLL